MNTTPKPNHYMLYSQLSLILIAMLFSTTVMAHAEQGVAGGLLSGLLHPVNGFDHLIAMLAVGLWGAQLGNPAIWLLPITFPLVMALGAMLGMLGIPVPFIELGIAASAITLGIMVALHVRPALWFAALIVGVFAIFHGHAHGTELPSAVNPLAYGVGFVVATGLLHLSGIVVGLLVRWPAGEKVVRVCGGGIALLGMSFMVTAVGA